MLPLHTHAIGVGLPPDAILKVLTLSEALEGHYQSTRTLIDQRQGPEISPGAFRKLNFAGVLGGQANKTIPRLEAVTRQDVIAPGDVIRLRARGQVSVLFRRSANANFLFATERCNSACLMCSQPPRDEDDTWRVREILDTIPLIDRDIAAIGMTGGEPTLLGLRLREIVISVLTHLGNAQFNILTNGRLLADSELAARLATGTRRVLWAIPLYADTAARHDHVVQAEGAFDETLNGLYNLAERGEAVEIRIVLHALTIDRLLPFAEFVWRNLPFVAHVAFMGLEPMGFAKINRDLLYVDAADYRAQLEEAVWYLHDRGIKTSIYNTPLCLLSQSARPLARKSISDWKNTFPPECDPCAMREQCSGFFRSAGAEWRSRHIHPIFKEART